MLLVQMWDIGSKKVRRLTCISVYERACVSVCMCVCVCVFNPKLHTG